MQEVDAFVDEYIRRFSERDVEGVTAVPRALLAIREGVPIHMPDRDAARYYTPSSRRTA